MHRKKYFLLLPPTLILGLFLIYYLPAEATSYVILVPLVFWIAYYSWIYIEKKSKENKS